MELAKGVRDYPPEIQLIREDLFQKIRIAFERHGFSPFAAPIIERMETLRFKFTDDADVMKEIFPVSDQGERNLGLRFDLTVPLARFVSMNKDLKLPFKRYEIGRVYRDGPIKLGRYREFWQCDADIVGSSSSLADAECIKVLADVLSRLPFEFRIEVNNRTILDEVMDHVGIEDHAKTMMILDKIKKQGELAVQNELSGFLSKEHINLLFEILTCAGTDNGKIKHIEQYIGETQGIKEIREVLSFLKEYVHVQFTPTLARGLNYYTSTIIEAFLEGTPIESSVAGGGRYDNIIGQMRGTEEKIPAVGISFGIEPLTDALLSEKQRFDKTRTQIFISPIKTERECSQIADKLRAKGMRVDIDVMGRNISKNLDYADKMGIPFVLIIGPRDLQKQQGVLKNMREGEESIISLTDLESFDLATYQ